jgi:hypothetical protein
MQHHQLMLRDGSPDESGSSPVPPTQQFSHDVGIASDTGGANRDRHPQVFLTGDLRLSVTEQEVARGPITGQYTIEAQDLRKPPFVLWQADNGGVLNRSARSTAITFDLGGVRADQIWTSEITVQVTDAETYDTIVLGAFVQILVTNDPVLSPRTASYPGWYERGDDLCWRDTRAFLI